MRPDRIVRRHLRNRYLITVRSDETFEGLLVDADARTLVLASAFQVSPAGGREPITGQLFIPRDTVKYLQQLAQA